MEPTSTLQVALTAIQNEYLVLETLEDKSLIYWPLKKLKRPLKIGHQLSLELKDEKTDPYTILNKEKADTVTKTLHDSEEQIKQAKLCKMLEDLVN